MRAAPRPHADTFGLADVRRVALVDAGRGRVVAPIGRGYLLDRQGHATVGVCRLLDNLHDVALALAHHYGIDAPGQDVRWLVFLDRLAQRGVWPAYNHAARVPCSPYGRDALPCPPCRGGERRKPNHIRPPVTLRRPRLL